MHWRGADCKKINEQFEVINIAREEIKILPNESFLFGILVDLSSSGYPFLGFTPNFERCLLYFSTYYDLDSVIDISWGYFESDICLNLNL